MPFRIVVNTMVGTGKKLIDRYKKSDTVNVMKMKQKTIRTSIPRANEEASHSAEDVHDQKVNEFLNNLKANDIISVTPLILAGDADIDGSHVTVILFRPRY